MKTGCVRNYYDEERTKIKKEYFIFNGKIEGEHIEYNKDGSIYQLTPYVNGKEHGISKKFFILCGEPVCYYIEYDNGSFLDCYIKKVL